MKAKKNRSKFVVLGFGTLIGSLNGASSSVVEVRADAQGGSVALISGIATEPEVEIEPLPKVEEPLPKVEAKTRYISVDRLIKTRRQPRNQLNQLISLPPSLEYKNASRAARESANVISNFTAYNSRLKELLDIAREQFYDKPDNPIKVLDTTKKPAWSWMEGYNYDELLDTTFSTEEYAFVRRTMVETINYLLGRQIWQYATVSLNSTESWESLSMEQPELTLFARLKTYYGGCWKAPSTILEVGSYHWDLPPDASSNTCYRSISISRNLLGRKPVLFWLHYDKTQKIVKTFAIRLSNFNDDPARGPFYISKFFEKTTYAQRRRIASCSAAASETEREVEHYCAGPDSDTDK